jgi:class 3 adenylate cyclase
MGFASGGFRDLGIPMSDLQSWLRDLGLEKYDEVMRANDIDLAVAADLTEQDLEKLGLSLGHRRRFLTAAAKLRATADAPVAAPTRPPSDQSPSVAERRQLTVAFVDLVGATAFGTQLDPEDLIRLLRQYRETCTAAVGRYGGYIAQYLGDGILIYYGFPKAQEDAAERAVRASLEIVEEVGLLRQPNGQPLQARIGVATGLVVAGVTSGVGPAGEETVVGDTPNLAARLQSAAAPDSVLVAPSTHRLTRHLFEFSFFGETAVKGFGEPVPVWRALRESAVDSRFAAAHAAAGPIIGRERELAFLYDSWQRAVRGNGHMMLLVGEAGMGKSRLLEAFADRIREEPSRILRCQCSPYHGNSALYPFERLLRHRLGVSRELSDQDNLDRIDRLLSRFDRHSRIARLLLAELFEIRSADMLSPLEMTPTQRKEETLAVLEDLLLAPHEGPVLLLVEDMHWSDQTTRALVDRILKRVGSSKALVVMTHRPELEANWSGHPDVTPINCKPIGQEHCEALIRQVASRQQIGASLIREIAARSDGVPLFAEELTKAVLELRSPGAGAVPLTLQDTLMARLDRLGRAKDIAQIAAVIGRQFSLDLLQAIAGSNLADLRAGLARLREAGLIFAAEAHDQSQIYSFNHSLAQEAAYESLSRDRRQVFHKAIARFLEERPAAEEDNEPALIAHHYSCAREPEKAVNFWLQAADRSGQRLAFADSIASLGSALTEAGHVGDPAQRARLKADAQLKLGTTLAIYRGPQTVEAEAALEEARRLAEEAGAGPQMFQATWGLYLNAARTQRLDKAKLRGEQLLEISERLGDEDLKFEALHHQWGYATFSGQINNIIKLTTDALGRYDRDRHHRFSFVFAGHDPGACAHCVRSLGLALAGRATSVRPALDAGLDFSHSLQHPPTLAFYYSVASWAAHVAGDAESCREFAEGLAQAATKYEFPLIGGVSAFMLGAARALQREPAAALRQMEPSFESAVRYGFFAAFPGVMMVGTLADAGRNDEALKMVNGLIDGLATPEMGIFVPELWRLRGELLLRQSAEHAMEAERCLRVAEHIAREQGAAILHLKAGTSLAELLAESGRREEARAVLDVAMAYPLDEWTGSEPAKAAQLRSALA